MSNRNIEPGWHEPVQDTSSDEWEEELNALHETVIRVVDGTETPISVHAISIPDGRDGTPLNADDEVRSNTLNQSSADSSPAAESNAPAGAHAPVTGDNALASDESEPPAIMRAFSASAGFVKDNAVAAAATAAAGIGWLIWNARTTPGPAPAPETSDRSIIDKAGDIVDKVKDRSSDVLDQAKETGGNVIDSAKAATSGVVESVKSTTSGVIDGVKSTGSSAVQSVSSAVGGAAQKVGSVGKDGAKRVGSAALGVAKASPIELAVTILSAAWLYRSTRPEPSASDEPSKLDQMTDQAKTGSRTALQAIEGAVQRNPLAAGAIALTIGAIIGLLFPESSIENRVMGPKHDELMDKAMGAAQEFTEDITGKVMAVATEAVNTVKEEAKHQGLVPGGDAQPASGVGDIPADSEEADKSPANAI